MEAQSVLRSKPNCLEHGDSTGSADCPVHAFDLFSQYAVEPLEVALPLREIPGVASWSVISSPGGLGYEAYYIGEYTDCGHTNNHLSVQTASPAGGLDSMLQVVQDASASQCASWLD